MLQAAAPGSTIDLGNRPVAFARYHGLSNVTIKGGIFGAITIDQWQNVTFSGSKFTPNAGDDPLGALIIAYQPDGLTFDNTTFTGAMMANGYLGFSSISLRGGNNVVIKRSNFHDLSNHLSFIRTTNVQITDNTFANIREGVDLVGVTNAVVARNRIGPFLPMPGDHADGVQFFTAGLTNADDQAARNVTIENNLIDPGPTYHAQGVFMADEANLAAAGRGYANITIRNNLLIGTGWHGITSGAVVDNLTITGNTLLIRITGDGVTDNWIMVGAGTAIVSNNYAGSFNLAQGVTASGNTAVKRAATDAEIAAAMATFNQMMQASAGQ